MAYLSLLSNSRHRAVNLFLSEYCNSWLTDCRQANMESLSEQLLVSSASSVVSCEMYLCLLGSGGL